MSESSAEKIWSHVKSLPEPLQSILKRKLGIDEISTPARAIAKRFNLSEEESNAFETEATLAVVGLTDPATFKDDLIAEVGLNYETAVRVQRAFDSEVLQPLSSEVEAASPPPPPVDISPVPAQPLFKDEFCRITHSTLELGPTSHRISSIASVMTPCHFPFEFGGFVLNVALLLFGLWGIGHFTSGWLIAGGIAAAIGGFNVYSSFNRIWWIPITLANGSEVKIERKKKAEIDAIYSALRKAMNA